MEVLFLTQFFYPDIQATSQIFLELCEDLAEDFEVKVVCGPPLIKEPAKASYNITANRCYKKMDIVRLFSARIIKKALIDRLINHVSFAISSFVYFIFHKKADLFIFTSDNPMNVINTIFFLRKPRVYICQDIYIEQGLRVGIFKNIIIIKILSLFQRLSFVLSDKVVVIGSKMKDYIEERGISPRKIEVISNWSDTKKILPQKQENPFSIQYGLAGKFVVMHSGRLGLTQDMGLLLECAHQMRSYDDIKFVIVGEGVKKRELMELARKKFLKNLIFLTYQPKDELTYSLAAASILVILYKKSLSDCLVPSRLYTFMASARPVIITSEEGSETHDIVKKSNCGIVIGVGDINGLKNAILNIYNDRSQIAVMGQSGRDYVVNNFSRSLMTGKYKALLKGFFQKQNRAA